MVLVYILLAVIMAVAGLMSGFLMIIATIDLFKLFIRMIFDAKGIFEELSYANWNET